MNKAIFLDKDGTLLFNVPYNVDPALILLQKNIIEGLKILQENGYLLIVITNQSGVAFGYFEERDLLNVREKTASLLGKAGIYIDDFYYCPHHPDGYITEYAISCDCRKPAAGMLFDAAEKHHIDLSQSWMIGDILNDVEVGNRAGCRTVLIDNGNETEWNLNEKRIPDLIAANINEAADLLLITDDILSPKNIVSMLGFA